MPVNERIRTLEARQELESQTMLVSRKSCGLFGTFLFLHNKNVGLPEGSGDLLNTNGQVSADYLAIYILYLEVVG